MIFRMPKGFFRTSAGKVVPKRWQHYILLNLLTQFKEMHQFSKKEKYLVTNTLSCVPIVLEGHAVLIDLLNESSVAGLVEKSDGYMNMHLNNVVYIDRNGQQNPFDEFMVRARMIRQIHIPGYLDIEAELKNYTESGRPQMQRNRGKRTFKQKRAEERHKEIVLEITAQKKEQIRKED